MPPNRPGNIYGDHRDPVDILKNYYKENPIPPQTHKFPSGSRPRNRAPSVPDSLISQDKLEEECERWFKGHLDNPLAPPVEKEIKTEEEASFAKFAEEGGVAFIDFLISMQIIEGTTPVQFHNIARLMPKEQLEWRTSMLEELSALRKQGVYELIDLPKGQRAIKNCWVYNIKSDGQKRSRLVAKGFS
jgi:hypothetical protein